MVSARWNHSCSSCFEPVQRTLDVLPLQLGTADGIRAPVLALVCGLALIGLSLSLVVRRGLAPRFGVLLPRSRLALIFFRFVGDPRSAVTEPFKSGESMSELADGLHAMSVLLA